MKITLIAAISENNVIGKDGKLSWNIPEDLKRFRELTLEHPVIMGRKTYESIPAKFKPLKGRKNIVMSNSLNSQDGIYIARNIGEALALTENKDTYIIGGAEIYKLFLPIADELEITRIHRNYDGDAHFPEIEWNEWKLVRETEGFSEDEKIPYFFQTYSRLFAGKRMIISQ